MVVSLLNTCGTSGVLNQPNLETTIHWRETPQDSISENEQQNTRLNFNNHDQRPSSPVQNGEENSCYGSENGAENLSPPQETSRSSGSEDLGVNLFPISGCNMSQQCLDYSNSDNESSQASPSSFHDDDSFRSGKAGSSSGGKPKLHKCRSCTFSTTNKHESWEHIAIHMKPEKILRCPECPFVTEYKHHLDFHIWNHQGMKPYKCDRCPYVCVNKSMLKSHSKSHSSIYQYNCGNCTYKTKYCHSLKIHLRKYQHEPGEVLDADGKPNPNPVIDVYGNRRGPKQKPKKQENNILPLQPAIPAFNAFPNFSWVNNVFPCSVLTNPIINGSFALETPKPDMTSHETDNLNNNVKLTENYNNNNNNNNNNISSNNNNNLLNNSDCIKNEEMICKVNCSSDEEDMYHPHSSLRDRAKVSPSILSHLERQLLMAQRKPPVLAEEMTVTERPTMMPEQSTIKVEPPAENAVIEEAPLNLSLSYHISEQQPENAGMPLVKNRRKGVACKLKRPILEEDTTKSVTTTGLCAVPMSSEAINLVSRIHEKNHETDNELLAKQKNKKNYFYCDYCEITFFNQIMFTMHIGYHGYSDPFKCNRCGEKTANKIDFYAHMISAAHL